MSLTPLKALRWLLMSSLASLIVYFLCHAVMGVFSISTKAELSWQWFLHAAMLLVAYGFVLLVPAIMLRSLVIKNLEGFSACLGMMISLGAFTAAVGLPARWGVMDLWNSIPDAFVPVKVVGGLILAISLLVLPFWLMTRLISWTVEFLYPKMLKPLESKL